MKIAAYVARYGRQQWSEIMRMPVTLLMQFANEIAELIRKENQPGRHEDL